MNTVCFCLRDKEGGLHVFVGGFWRKDGAKITASVWFVGVVTVKKEFLKEGILDLDMC